MRINLRKFIVISCCLVLLWFIVSYSSFIQMPASGSKHSINELEVKLDELESKLQDQISDSKLLLNKLRQRMKKTEKQNVNDPNEDEIDAVQRKYMLYYLFENMLL